MPKDINIFKHDGSHFSQLLPSFEADKLEGLKAVIQRFVITLLTPLGSKKSDPTAGTKLLAVRAAGNITDPQMLEGVVAEYVASAKAQLVAEDRRTGASPADSIGDATLVDHRIDYDKGVLYLKVKITNLNNDGYEIQLPI